MARFNLMGILACCQRKNGLLSIFTANQWSLPDVNFYVIAITALRHPQTCHGFQKQNPVHCVFSCN